MSLNLLIPHSPTTEYQCLRDLNLYNSPECVSLTTQAATGRHLKITSNHQNTAVTVRLCEDDYPGWLSLEDYSFFNPQKPYINPNLSRPQQFNNTYPLLSLLPTQQKHKIIITFGVVQLHLIMIVLV